MLFCVLGLDGAVIQSSIAELSHLMSKTAFTYQQRGHKTERETRVYVTTS